MLFLKKRLYQTVQHLYNLLIVLQPHLHPFPFCSSLLFLSILSVQYLLYLVSPFTLFFCHLSTWKNNCSEFTLSLCLPLPHLLSSLPLLDPEGITLSEPNVPQTCQMMFVFHPLSHACFFSFFLPVCFNAVYIFDKVLWDALPSHVNRLKFCSIINETKIYRVVVCVCMCGGEWGLGGVGVSPKPCVIIRFVCSDSLLVCLWRLWVNSLSSEVP